LREQEKEGNEKRHSQIQSMKPYLEGKKGG